MRRGAEHEQRVRVVLALKFFGYASERHPELIGVDGHASPPRLSVGSRHPFSQGRRTTAAGPAWATNRTRKNPAAECSHATACGNLVWRSTFPVLGGALKCVLPGLACGVLDAL